MTEEVAELLKRWMAAADDVALAFAYESDSRVDASLARMRQNLIEKFLVLFPSAPPETMAAGVDSIIRSIQDRKREIERDSIAVHLSKN
jgi:threonine synthase